jgi:hypothetical protein
MSKGRPRISQWGQVHAEFAWRGAGGLPFISVIMEIGKRDAPLVQQEVTAMRTFNRYILIAGMAGSMAWMPSLMAQEKDRDQHDQGSVQEAIRFEKAKEAAAERQERIEEANAGKPHQQKASTSRRGDADTRKHGTADRTAPAKVSPR